MSNKPRSNTTGASKQKDSHPETPSTETHPQTFAEASKIAGDERTTSIHGTAVDPTPDAHYTVKGVVAGKPTPETNIAHANAVREGLTDPGEKLPVVAHKSLQKAADIESKQGFRGIGIDQEPNETYTVAGVQKTQPETENKRRSGQTGA
jgi:hypothetical protein